jgi:hypothetical protein
MNPEQRRPTFGPRTGNARLRPPKTIADRSSTRRETMLEGKTSQVLNPATEESIEEIGTPYGEGPFRSEILGSTLYRLLHISNVPVLCGPVWGRTP